MTEAAVDPHIPGHSQLAHALAHGRGGRLVEAARELNVAFAAENPADSLHAPWLEGAKIVVTTTATAADPHPQLLMQMAELVRNLLKVKGKDDTVDDLFIIWLRSPRSYDRRLPNRTVCQHPVFLERLGDLLAWDKITFAQDEAAIRRFLYWVNAWDLARRLTAKHTLELIAERFPHRDLWATVTFPVANPEPPARGRRRDQRRPQRYAPKEQ